MSAATVALYAELESVRQQITERRAAERTAAEKSRRAHNDWEKYARALHWAEDEEEKLIAALQALDCEIPPKEKP